LYNSCLKYLHFFPCSVSSQFCIGGVQVEFKQFHHLLPTFLLDFVSNTPILLIFPLLPLPEFDWDMFSHNRTLGVVVRCNHHVWFLGLSNAIELLDDKSASRQPVATSLHPLFNCCVCYRFLCASIQHIDRNIAIIGCSRYVYRQGNESWVITSPFPSRFRNVEGETRQMSSSPPRTSISRFCSGARSTDVQYRVNTIDAADTNS
jgi:hypothetical protein